MCSRSCARVFSEQTYGLKVSFMFTRPICCCTKPQRYTLKSFNKGFQVNTNLRLASTKLLWKPLQNATMLQHHGKRGKKWPIKLHIKRCDVEYPICQLTGLQRPSDTAWYVAGEHLYRPCRLLGCVSQSHK